MILIVWLQLFLLFLVQKTNCDISGRYQIIHTNHDYNTVTNLSDSYSISTINKKNTPSTLNKTSVEGRFFSKHKSDFMAGFGLGLLAFAVKKMLLPLILGAQIIKSIIIAMFLPSILGGIGKFLGKGLQTVSNSASMPSSATHDYGSKEIDFGDPSLHSREHFINFNNFAEQPSTMRTVDDNLHLNDQISRFGSDEDETNQYFYYNQFINNNKIPNYKTLEKIPESSAFLTNYDPFYSPLLSRLDAIFQKLNMDQSESCREKLICQMYGNPVKFAPYSNFVSVQLSKELYELRRPISDSPEILRFFKYLRAAKWGQDNQDCVQYETTCPSLNNPVPALITSYNEIDKLVSARKF